MKKKSKIIFSILAVILLLVVGFAVAVASALHIEVDYDDPESLAVVAEQAECYLVMTHPDTDSPELQAALKELNDIALLDVPDGEKIGHIRARFPEESFWPDELKDLLRSAESGDRDAQYRLGCLYLNDSPERIAAGRELMKYVVPNVALAEKWLLKAARQGHADAQYRLSKCYEEWHPVLKNKDQAKERELELIEAEKEQWLRASARNGNMYALLHARGNSADVRDRARSMIREAAGQGDAVALEFDRFEFEHTYKCLLKNAENGSVFAMWKYAGLCGHGITEWVKDRTFSSERKKEVVIREPDAELAKQWRRKALDTAMKHLEEDGDPRDLYTIVSLYDTNFSNNKFMEWLIGEEDMADLADRIVPALWNADPSCPHTFRLLFDMHNARKEKGLEADDDAAFLRKLVKRCGLFTYRLRLAKILLKGTEEDKAEAVGLLRHLAGLGDPQARELLGQCCLDGTGGLPKDKAEAVKWFRKAAEQRVYPAMESLAICLKAPGDPHDEREAERWEWIVKERGMVDSKLELHYIQVRKSVKHAWFTVLMFLYRKS